MLHVLQVHSQRGVACETNRYMSGSSSMALCARNAHITVYDVTTWSWVNLVHPLKHAGRYIVVENDGGQFPRNCVWTSRVVRPQ